MNRCEFLSLKILHHSARQSLKVCTKPALPSMWLTMAKRPALGHTGEHDVIILDLMLPKIDGLSMLKTLRSGGCPAHVLVPDCERHAGRSHSWPSTWARTIIL